MNTDNAFSKMDGYEKEFERLLLDNVSQYQISFFNLLQSQVR